MFLSPKVMLKQRESNIHAACIAEIFLRKSAMTQTGNLKQVHSSCPNGDSRDSGALSEHQSLGPLNRQESFETSSSENFGLNTSVSFLNAETSRQLQTNKKIS